MSISPNMRKGPLGPFEVSIELLSYLWRVTLDC
jgi:hypothetical protein